MKVIVTGSNGLLGTALVDSLLAEGHAVTALTRDASRQRQADGVTGARWNPSEGTIEAAALEGHDAAVHLAGEPIAEGRWTDEKKRRIRESRAQGTRLIAETLADLERKPGVLVSASATGFYGDRGDEVLTEESASGEDFLSEVCREWEKATLAASRAGVRVVNLRFGIVITGKGGALQKMLTPFKLGVGGRIGGGGQYWSWLDVDDAVGVIKHAIGNAEVRGPVNAVSPNPVTNAEFTSALGDALGRPTIFPLRPSPRASRWAKCPTRSWAASASSRPG
jgi:uncharacterized protein (TIGR01777 family)